MSNFHSSFNDEDFENSATNYALSQNYDHDIDYNNSSSGANALNSQEEDEEEINNGEMKKKKNKDPNEPVKPVSAYAAFFRDTQIAIKSQNPDASFEEISKIVASMWEALDIEHKNVYKKNAEIAKKEYLRALSEYRANNMISDDSTSIVDNNSNSSIITSPNKKQLPIASKPAVFTIPTNDDISSTQIKSPGNTKISSPTSEVSDEKNSFQKCIRDGCTNRAVVNPDWEDEYCSNECAVKHCRNVFNNWVITNKESTVEEVAS